MKSEMKFEEWLKFDLRVGEVIELNKGGVKIRCCNKDFQANLNLNANKGDKIVIGIFKDKLVIPVVNKNIFLSPEKDIELGSRVR